MAKPKSKLSAVHSAYHEAKASHGATVSIKRGRKIYSSQETGTGGGSEYLLNNDLTYNTIAVYKVERALKCAQSWDSLHTESISVGSISERCQGHHERVNN